MSHIEKAKEENENVLENVNGISKEHVNELTVRIKIIEDALESVVDCYEQIIMELDDQNQAKEQGDKCYEIQLTVNKHIRTVKECINKLSSENRETERSSKNKANDYKQQNIRLPKIEIKKFSGDATEWQTFIDSFTCAIHENKSISNVEKMNYLINLLDGEAASTVKGLPLCNNNYEVSLKMLQDRYGDQQVLISSFMNKLLNLEPTSSLSDVTELRKLYDEIETQVRCLNSLGLDEKNYGAMLVPVVMAKLPQAVKLIISRQFGKNTWDIKLVLNALKSELEAMEKVSMSDSTESPVSSSSSFHKGEEVCSGMTLNVTTNPRDNRVVCVYCKKSSHKSFKCC